jgi:pyridoxine 5-phosphate synthase
VFRGYAPAVIRLHVNVDHVATLRNARGTSYPDPVVAAEACEAAGADGITLHLREDRRHIVDADVLRIRACVTTLMNFEMAATDEMITFAEKVAPDVITLVPERREEQTTEGGLDVVQNRVKIAEIAKRAEEAGIKLSLFIAADPEQIITAKEIGAAQIELHTGEYCHATGVLRDKELERLRNGARVASGLGLEVAAGHGLTRENVIDVAAIDSLVELNIGHALIADALFLGLSGAVKAFREAIDKGLAPRKT